MPSSERWNLRHSPFSPSDQLHNKSTTEQKIEWLVVFQGWWRGWLCDSCLIVTFKAGVWEVVSVEVWILCVMFTRPWSEWKTMAVSDDAGARASADAYVDAGAGDALAAAPPVASASASAARIRPTMLSMNVVAA